MGSSYLSRGVGVVGWGVAYFHFRRKVTFRKQQCHSIHVSRHAVPLTRRSDITRIRTIVNNSGRRRRSDLKQKLLERAIDRHASGERKVILSEWQSSRLAMQVRKTLSFWVCVEDTVYTDINNCVVNQKFC